MHRSGTTWVGKMLTASGEAVYIHEPLNPLHARGIFARLVDRYYLVLTEENEHQFLPAFRDTLRFRYRLSPQLRSTRSPNAAWVAVKDVRNFAGGRIMRRRPLLKDPFAVFSISWFIRRLGCEVVGVIRHPVACVSSLKRLDWKFDPQELLGQRVLEDERVQQYARRQRAIPKSDIVGHGALLWSLIASVLREARLSEDIQIVRHEDLAAEPLSGFDRLYDVLGLKLNRRARIRIARSTSSANPRQSSVENFGRTSLDSRASLLNWTERLDAADVERIYRLTQPVREEFYPDDDWVERLFRTTASR